MERRDFLGVIAGGLLAAPLAAEAQQPGKVYRIGLLDYASPDPARQVWWDAFRQQMRDLGYLEGQNIAFELRSAQDDVDRLPKLAAELVGLKVDLIVTGSQNAALAAKRATATTPIVTATIPDSSVPSSGDVARTTADAMIANFHAARVSPLAHDHSIT